MFRSLLAAALLMLSGTSFAADGLGKLHIFRDWVVGCDNTLRCEAQGYGSDRDDAPPGGRAALIIRREAGPGQPPVLHFTYSTFDNAPLPAAGQTVRLQVGSLRFDMPATTAQQPEPDVPASRVPALLAAVQKGDIVRLSAGSAQWHVSLDGAAAALLKMDDLQGRVGTPGALARKGTRPESSVPAPTVPEVKAARLPPHHCGRSETGPRGGHAAAPHRERLPRLRSRSKPDRTDAPDTHHAARAAALLARRLPDRQPRMAGRRPASALRAATRSADARWQHKRHIGDREPRRR